MSEVIPHTATSAADSLTVETLEVMARSMLDEMRAGDIHALYCELFSPQRLHNLHRREWLQVKESGEVTQ